MKIVAFRLRMGNETFEIYRNVDLQPVLVEGLYQTGDHRLFKNDQALIEYLRSQAPLLVDEELEIMLGFLERGD